MSSNAQHCSFVLLADFDIDKGAQLTYQFPQPLGTDEGLIANLMLPDGAERQPEDWTIFFLNQTHFNTIAPVLALETPETNGGSQPGELQEEENKPELLYVLNLVRTKLDKSVRRGAIVKAMAICTRHSFIEIFKPVLLMALDDYFMNPSQDCLARLFDAINSIDISKAPVMSRFEKLIMRTSERKDLFIEKFEEYLNRGDAAQTTAKPGSLSSHKSHNATDSVGSHSSFEEGLLSRTKDRSQSTQKRPGSSGALQPQPGQPSPSDQEFSLDSSVVWVGDESGLDQVGGVTNFAVGSHSSHSVRGRSSTDVSSSSSSHQQLKREESGLVPTTANNTSTLKDTHFFPAVMQYDHHFIPIRLPLSTFPEEVGDYSLITLVQLFANPNATINGPMHPHLHTNGRETPAIIVLFNALVTGKRIIFLGHHRPAGQVSSFVLSACALGSGCGIVLRGFIKRAFPYANLTNREEWETIPAYIAGVTNPIFESSGSWDLLIDVSSGRMVVSKDIMNTYPATTGPPVSHVFTRTGTLKTESSMGSEEEIVRSSKDFNPDKKVEIKTDVADTLFMEDIAAAISMHYGESHVRARFMEYCARFVRLAARYEEEVLNSITSIGYPTAGYSERPGENPRLGSGLLFIDDAAGARELSANSSRIEAFRRTESYKLFQVDFKKMLQTNPMQGFDVIHQIWRLRHSKRIPDNEMELIMKSLVENVQSYEQVCELLSYLPPHNGGLLPLSFGLFHQSETVRDLTVDLFNELRLYPVGVQFLQSLNHFQRYAYVRQAHARESRTMKEQNLNQLSIPFSNHISRTPSNHSESSLGGG
ncbi:docking domain of Afi1 for Arf3 in vesicle trafficking-domain-containing protein [Abortiporus biennis]|nr:docking domain of Afi1 for Arf3 in vesicle trafficking-domain-containing protein [Abortiporus biennis]